MISRQNGYCCFTKARGLLAFQKKKKKKSVQQLKFFNMFRAVDGLKELDNVPVPMELKKELAGVEVGYAFNSPAA